MRLLLTLYSQQTLKLVKQQNNTNIKWQNYTLNNFVTSTTPTQVVRGQHFGAQ